MSKNRRNNGQEQLNQMAHTAGLGSAWVAQMTEQNVSALDGMLGSVRRVADSFGYQASSIREHSAALVEQSMENVAEFGSKLARTRHPLEWAEVQSEFLSKQAQVIASGVQGLGEALVNGSNDVANAGLHQLRDSSRRGRRAA